MDSYDLFVINGVVVTDTSIEEVDIAVKDEKIAKLTPRGGLRGLNAKRVVDVKGGYVTPGGVDAHVHLAVSEVYHLAFDGG